MAINKENLNANADLKGIDNDIILKYLLKLNNENINNINKINELEQNIIELKYKPDNEGYRESKNHFESLLL